jgi:hypothetical protein
MVVFWALVHTVFGVCSYAYTPRYLAGQGRIPQYIDLSAGNSWADLIFLDHASQDNTT